MRHLPIAPACSRIIRGRIIVPSLLRDEFTNVVRGKTRQEALSADAAHQALAHFFTLPILFRDPHRLHHLALQVAIEHHLPIPYDAADVALARGAGCPLRTADQQFIRKCRASTVRPRAERVRCEHLRLQQTRRYCEIRDEKRLTAQRGACTMLDNN